MSLAIRILLFLGAALTFTMIVRYIRKSKVRIEDMFFWLLFGALLLLVSVFPQLAIGASELLGVQSPINFVYLLVIFILIAKQFFTSLTLSQLKIQVTELAQQMAIEKKDNE